MLYRLNTVIFLIYNLILIKTYNCEVYPYVYPGTSRPTIIRTYGESTIDHSKNSQQQQQQNNNNNNNMQFFFGSSNQQQIRNTQETTTESISTTTSKKEFTGIAFPSQVFPVYNGNEQTEEYLSGRRNTTPTEQSILLNVSKPYSSNNHQSLNKPSYTIRPPQPPPTPPSQQPHFTGVVYAYPPQPGSIAAAVNSNQAPDNRVGASSTNKPPTTTKRPQYVNNNKPYSSRPQSSNTNRPSFSTTKVPTTTRRVTTVRTTTTSTTTSSPVEETSTDVLKYSDIVKSIRSIHYYIQDIITSPDSTGNIAWDGKSNNFLISPLSIALTLAQMMLAGGPNTKSYIKEKFKFKNDSHDLSGINELLFHKLFGELVSSMQKNRPISKSSSNNDHTECTIDPYILTTDTAVFVQQGLAIRSTYIHSVDTLYNSVLSPLDFRTNSVGSLIAINKWAEEATQGKITEFLQALPSTNLAALFASSLYFKALWRNTFDETFTAPSDFHVTVDKKVSVPFMMGEVFNGSKYLDSHKFGLKALRLAYNETDDIAMYLFLPKNPNASIYDFSKKLFQPYNRPISARFSSSNYPNKNFQDPLPQSWEIHKQKQHQIVTRTENEEVNSEWELDEIISEMKEKVVSVKIPKLYLRGSLTLNPFKNIKDQLNGMLEDQAQAIGLTQTANIIHETVLEVTEAGTEGAAVTGGSVFYQSGSGTFRADRPFLIYVRHETTGIPLFWGAVVEPPPFPN